MPHRCSTSNRLVAGMAAVVLTIGAVMPADAGTATGAATEWTQVLNNGELVSLVGQSAACAHPLFAVRGEPRQYGGAWEDDGG